MEVHQEMSRLLHFPAKKGFAPIKRTFFEVTPYNPPPGKEKRSNPPGQIPVYAPNI